MDTPHSTQSLFTQPGRESFCASVEESVAQMCCRILGAYLAADIRASLRRSRIRLENESDDSHATKVLREGEATDNPLHEVDVPKKTLYIMFAGSIIGAIISANIFVVSNFFTLLKFI